MIIKSFEINKINFDQNKLVLFYGKNEGFKNEATNNLIKDKDEITKYEEKEVLENINDFIESILSNLFLRVKK
jgi:DNA polymerase-3 subunit delta